MKCQGRNCQHDTEGVVTAAKVAAYRNKHDVSMADAKRAVVDACKPKPHSLQCHFEHFCAANNLSTLRSPGNEKFAFPATECAWRAFTWLHPDPIEW